ncbi:hypothetical protein BG004_007698 [Podila humilis]|nr:hypothetical protein BG004_007698 [Podila humilis]
MSAFAPSVSLSIFDIPQIADAICRSLPFSDIKSYRLVNKHLSSIAKPHLWNTVRLRSIVPLTKIKIATLLEQRSRIQKLSVAAQHIEKISSSIEFTALKELVLYDENFGETYEGDPTNVQAIISLIDNNPHLESLEIDLNRYHYNIYPDGKLTPALLLAIHRHPTLSRLVWHVPAAHSHRVFTAHLLYVCRDKIQDLSVYTKDYSPPYCGICGGCFCSVADYDCAQFEASDSDHLPSELAPQLRQLVEGVASMETSIQQQQQQDPLQQQLSLHSFPYTFRRVRLSEYGVGDLVLDLVRNSPDLEDVGFNLVEDSYETLLDTTLQFHPQLRVLDLQHGGMYQRDYSPYLGRFHHLEKVYMNVVTEDQLLVAMEMLAQSGSQKSLKVLGIPAGSQWTAGLVYALQVFPSLQEIDLGHFKIIVRQQQQLLQLSNKPPTAHEMEFSHTWDDAFEGVRPNGTMLTWTSLLEQAQTLCASISSAWTKSQSTTRVPGGTGIEETSRLAALTAAAAATQEKTISYKFMLPAREFLSESVATEYWNGTGS